jgi:hypothetical protein
VVWSIALPYFWQDIVAGWVADFREKHYLEVHSAEIESTQFADGVFLERSEAFHQGVVELA